MPIYTGVRSEDVRALAVAIVLGSSIGLALGGACLLGGGPNSSKPQAVFQSAGPTPTAAPGAARSAVASSGPQGFAAGLRGRFRLGDVAPARPFAVVRVAEASTDLHCLAETVYFEARGESQDGQRAVAQVVLNRVRHPAFPKTICAVVHQRTAGSCQFAFACSSRDAATNSIAWRRAETVAYAALHGAVMGTVGDATHFQTARSGAFAGLMRVAQIGAHVFYRFAGRAGAATMFHQTPAPSAPAAVVELARLDLPKTGQVTPDPPQSVPGATTSKASLKSPPVAAAPTGTGGSSPTPPARLASTEPDAKAGVPVHLAVSAASSVVSRLAATPGSAPPPPKAPAATTGSPVAALALAQS